MKKNLEICEKCRNFYHQYLVNMGVSVCNEYRCDLDEYITLDENDSGAVWSTYVNLEKYLSWDISKDCPYQLEHIVIDQKGN